jgi:hypothetical protein
METFQLSFFVPSSTLTGASANASRRLSSALYPGSMGSAIAAGPTFQTVVVVKDMLPNPLSSGTCASNKPIWPLRQADGQKDSTR